MRIQATRYGYKRWIDNRNRGRGTKKRDKLSADGWYD